MKAFISKKVLRNQLKDSQWAFVDCLKTRFRLHRETEEKMLRYKLALEYIVHNGCDEGEAIAARALEKKKLEG